MWMINPSLLCNKHLIGEHGEIHKHRHVFEKQYSVSGRISPVVQIQPQDMEKRHNELAKEMISRGFNHNSPYTQPDISYLPEKDRYAKVNLRQSKKDLMQRCFECNQRIQKRINQK
jgi:hypothetical protein